MIFRYYGHLQQPNTEKTVCDVPRFPRAQQHRGLPTTIVQKRMPRQ